MPRTCPKCGMKNNDKSKECVHCYTSFSTVVIKEETIENKINEEKKTIPTRCPFCDSKMKKNNSTCPGCFKDVLEVKKKFVVSKSKATPDEKIKIKNGIIIIIFIVVFILIAILSPDTTDSKKDNIDKQFSVIDGSHYGLTRLLKSEILKDPKSYEHIKTIYWDNDTFITVETKYRAKNSFGGMVQETIKCNVDLNGNILKIVE